MKLSELCKQLAQEKNMPYIEVARALKVASGQVSNWFNGNSFIPPHRAEQLALLFHKNPKEYRTLAIKEKLLDTYPDVMRSLGHLSGCYAVTIDK